MSPALAWHTLGLAPGASPADVRRAFRVAAQLLHPDRADGLGDDVRAEAHRRMVELAEAYRVCTALAAGAPPPPPRSDDVAANGLRSAGEQAASMLASAREALRHADGWDAAREAVVALEQIADAWPGTAEGDAARVLLVGNAVALSARERAGHLVLVLDPAARDEAWDSLSGRDELAVAQVVYAHPIADESLRRKARQRLMELDDWATVAADDDPDVRRTAAAHLLLRDSLSLADRAPWLSRRERAGFDAEYAAWRARVASLGHVADSLREDLATADAKIAAARG